MTAPRIYETSVDWDPALQLAKTRYICLQGAYDLRPILQQRYRHFAGAERPGL